MNVPVLELAGAIGACVCAGAALVIRDPRLRQLSMLAALALATALVVGQVWDQNRLADLRSHPLLLTGIVIAALAALALGSAVMVRLPALFPILAFAMLPVRVPFEVGGESNYLLIPLYAAIAGGLGRALWLALRSPQEVQQAGSPRAGEPVAVRWLAIALAASIVIYAIGIAWSSDHVNAVRNVSFFLVPFAVLFALLRDLRWHRGLIRGVLIASVVMAAIFAVIALAEYASRELIFNQDLQDANQLHLYFRANSLFRDPNIYGRYLALVIVALAAFIAWPRPRAHTLAAFGLAIFLVAGVIVSFSITSFMALAAGIGAIAWFRLGWRGLVASVAVGLAAIACYAVVLGSPADTGPAQAADIEAATSGRGDLVTGGIDLFEARPAHGWGSGSFANAFRREVAKVVRPVSHNEPITVAAEQGFLGLIPYIAIVAFGMIMLVRPWPSARPSRAGVAACMAALFVHSMGYAGFAIDPATWALLALGVVLRVSPAADDPAAAEPPAAAA